MNETGFEESLGRLEALVQRLERENLPLEEGLRAFEEGITLARQCQARLDAAERTIELLSVADPPSVDRDA
ncbi:MAG: exodeoxyribonuclease VII small subunit [Magnetococcales bacterium]|nr:exodeoxyribonuclease VII small subunit [Magnetococcales bacterium]